MSDRRQLLQLAHEGNSEAQFDLACAYDFDIPKDHKRAVRWYRKAADQGHAEAQNLLAECLREGVGTRKSNKEAVYWFRQSALQGYADAQVSLGYALYYGTGIKKDVQEAFVWYRKAARQGHPSAQLNIGHMYRQGVGVRQSWQRAIAWYKKAAAFRPNGPTSSLAAMHWLGRIYGGEEDHRPNVKQAVHWYTLAAERGDSQSQCSLGVHYMNGDGVPRDPKVAANWYRQAALQNDEWACYLLGLCYRDGLGVRANRRWARHWLSRAKDAGVKKAHAALQSLETISPDHR
ncbi:MAG: sel1 repeat family protein [Planctomycetaceae bacterium]|nr:sel1 repeat family protein [Planctomycetaceae bacterium]